MSGLGSQRPLPPWHPFPLHELLVFVGLVCAAGAVLTWGTPRALWFAAAALTAGLAGGLEAALREQLTGWREHTATLAGAVACGASLVATRLDADWRLVLVAAAVTFAATGLVLRVTFRRRS
jgi:hypothetical protein